MKAGILNEQILIEEPTTTKDQYGATSVAWSTFANTRASVSYQNGGRVIENEEIVNNYTKTFTIRYYHDINEQMRIIWKGDKYRILTINRNRNLQLIQVVSELINE